MIEGFDYVFIDTAPTMWVVVQEAIRAATLVLIPARPGFFDLDAVRETVKTARERDKPYAVVINAAPVKRDDKESPVVALVARLFGRPGVPVWSGQISQRAGYSVDAGGRRERRRDRPRRTRPPAPRSPSCGRRSTGASRRSTPRMPPPSKMARRAGRRSYGRLCPLVPAKARTPSSRCSLNAVRGSPPAAAAAAAGAGSRR